MLYRFEAKIVGRQAKGAGKKPIPGKQVSVVAKSAYRAGETLFDERMGRSHTYANRSGQVFHKEILGPENMRPEFQDRATLWNAVEHAERKQRAQLAREIIITLPRALPEAGQVAAVRAWAEENLVSKGFIADICFHKGRDENQPHCHVLQVMRPCKEGSKTGFGNKPVLAWNSPGAVGLGSKKQLEGWRTSWESHCNAALEAAGIEDRVDCRSLRERGIDKEPEPVMGVYAATLRRQGIDSPRARLVRHSRLENYARGHMAAIQEQGEVNQRDGLSWWERAQDGLGWGMDRFRDLLRDEAGHGARAPSWQEYVAARMPDVERSIEAEL